MKVENGTIEQLINKLAQMQKRIVLVQSSSRRSRKDTDAMMLYNALQKQQEEQQIILDSIPAMIFYKNRENRMLRVNRAFTETMGLPKEKIEGKTCLELWPEQAEKYWMDDKEVMTLEQAKRGIIEPLETTRGTRWIETDKIPYKDESGNIVGVIGFAIDVTERRKAEEALQKSEEEFRLIFENAKDAIFWADPKTGIIIRCNKAAEGLLEKTRDEIIGYPQTSLHPTEKIECHTTKLFEKHVKQRGAIDDEAEVITKSGKIKPVHITASITSVGGRPIIQGIFRDITDRKLAEQELKSLNKQLLGSNRKLNRLALKDPQTGLYNQRFFEETIESEFYRAKRYSHALSLILMDIDYFKSVNDVYGYKFGDLVLNQFAKKIRKLVRLHDYVVRFGDEKFIIILPGTNRADALILANRISAAIKIYKFGNGKDTVKLRVSVAVASYPEDDIFKSMDLVELGEKILHRVKECGGDRVFSSNDTNDKTSSLTERVETTDSNYLKHELIKLTRQSNQSLTESIFAFARTIELKDRFTGEHVEKTVSFARKTAERLGLSQTDILLIEQASILHDLGKIGISEKILLKNGKLTKDEFEKIKEHPKIGIDIIRPVQFLHGLVPLILYHHERWDGKGYPCALKGEEIPIGARVIAIADVYQALISDRPYRRAMPEKEAIKIIKDGSGTQFDPKVTEAFLKILQKEHT